MDRYISIAKKICDLIRDLDPVEREGVLKIAGILANLLSVIRVNEFQ